MNKKFPHSPFTTRLSGSAKETELRIRNIFQWKKKRPPVVLFVLIAVLVLSCCSLVSCQTQADEPPAEDNDAQQVSPLEGDVLSPDGKYEVRLTGSPEGVSTSSDGLTPPESVQIVDVQSNEVLWECDGLYRHAVLWSPDSAYLALASTARTYCTVTIIETKSWTNWDVTLPDGSAIPEYTFLPDEGWGEWLVEHNFLLTIGQGNKDGQSTYRCVPIPQDGGLTGITEPLTAEDTPNDPSTVLSAMSSIQAKDFTNPEYFGTVTAEALAEALNAAVDKQISEAEFMDALGGSYAGVFPHWYIEDAWLEGGSGGHPGTDRNLDIRCGLPENIVEVTLSEDNHRNTAYFRDETLYQLVRHGNDYEEIVDPVAYEKFKNLLVPKMESVLAQMEHNPGNFTGYELKRFILAWSYEDERDGSQIELYHFDFGLLTDTPETVGWAGGMALDSKLRVSADLGPGQLAVKYRNGQVVCTTFMGNDFYYSPGDVSQADWAKERINGALDWAEIQAADPAVSHLRQEYFSAPVYYLGEEPPVPQEGDWRIDSISYQGGTRLYETIGRAYDLTFSTYHSSQWNQNSSRCLVLSLSIDGTLNAIEGISRVTTESMPAESIILQVANNLMDLEVSLWRDGYAWPAGPGNQVQFHREVYDGSETIEVLENWEPIYSDGDYWAIHCWNGFEALCYHHADTGTYNINRIDTTRTDLFTHRGIRVGDSRTDVMAAYPELKSGDYWGQYPDEDILWYCADPNDFGAALIFFFEGNTVSRIVLNNMFN